METNDLADVVVGRKELPCYHCGEPTHYRCSGCLKEAVCQHPCCFECAERDNDCPYMQRQPKTNGFKWGQEASDRGEWAHQPETAPAVESKPAPLPPLLQQQLDGQSQLASRPPPFGRPPDLGPAPAAATRELLPTATGFVKADNGKLQIDLVPPHFVEGVAAAMHYGAVTKGYGRGNYLKGAAWSRYIAAALRHLNSWRKGEENDPESGINHLYHAAACLVILTESQRLVRGTDDRKEVTG
jgi:hypothetical protein